MTAYWCNKCGYSGPVQNGHLRPGAGDKCEYIATEVPPPLPGECRNMSECTSANECFGRAPGCRRTLGVAVTPKKQEGGA